MNKPEEDTDIEETPFIKVEPLEIEDGEIDLAQMVKIEKSEQTYACHECDYKSFSKEELMQHVCRICCKHCNYMAKDDIEFQRHMLKHKKVMNIIRLIKNENGEQTFACYECDYKSISKEEFRLHVCLSSYKKNRQAGGVSMEDEIQKRREYNRERYNKNKETYKKYKKYILPPGFSSRLHLLNVLSNIWRSLGNGIWSSFNHHQLCKHSEHCRFCFVRNLSTRTRKKSRHNLEPYEIQTLLDVLGSEDASFKKMVSESISFMGASEPTMSSGCCFLQVTEDNCENSNLSDIIEKSSDLNDLQDKKIIFIFFESATKIEIGENFVFNSIEFKYGCHIQETNSTNEYKCHFLHNNRIVCDEKGAIMPSSTSDNDNVKFVVLIKDSLNSDVPREFTYGDAAMKWIKKKSLQAMDKKKYEERKYEERKKREGYHIKYREEHRKMHSSGIKPYKCDECSKSFSTKQTLLTHKQIHTGIKPFKCDECPKAFSTKQIMQTHKQLHTGIKPFQCYDCSKSFPTKPHLLTHKQIHTGIKPFLCDECPKTFSTKQILENHKLIHSRIKPFNPGNISIQRDKEPITSPVEQTIEQEEELASEKPIPDLNRRSIRASKEPTRFKNFTKWD